MTDFIEFKRGENLPVAVNIDCIESVKRLMSHDGVKPEYPEVTIIAIKKSSETYITMESYNTIMNKIKRANEE